MSATGGIHRYLEPGAGPLPGQHRRVLFLDRDGVINVNHGYVHTRERTDFLPGIFEYVAGAQREGFDAVVVTNQAGIARGYYDEAAFLDYTRWLHARFAEAGAPLLATYFCPHHPEGSLDQWRLRCACRKPEPGMLLAAADELGIDLGASMLVGDQPHDIAAAQSAGVGRTRLLQGALGPWTTQGAAA